jgi:hypothetical protein
MIRIMLFGFPLVLLALPAQAQIFMCKDPHGKTITSDRPIPECIGAIREFSSSGKIKRTIPPPLTAEEKKQKQLDEERRKAEAEAAAELKRQDRAILARYNNENEINMARKRAIDQEQEIIKRETLSLSDAEKQLASAKKQVDEHTAKKTRPPITLTQKVELTELSILTTKRTVKEHEEVIEQTNTKFDETLKRFRELTAAIEKK